MSQEHYFSADPRVPSRPRSVQLRLRDRTIDLLTDRGVFAYGQIDRGTALLLENLPPPPAGDLADVGCGYGVIAISVALRRPDARVWAVDVNRRALELCRRNAAEAGVVNLVAAEPDQLPPGLQVAAVYSNPPVRLGKPALHELLDDWLARLEPGGHAHLVVQRHLGADSLAAWLDARGRVVQRIRSRGGYRVLDVHVAAASPHDEPL